MRKDAAARPAKNTKSASRNGHNARHIAEGNTALDRCYGQIGISAVAAAVRYQGAAKNMAYAPATTVGREGGAVRS